MGKFTPICDTISIIVLLIIWVFCFFPLTNSAAPTDMNWAVAIYGAVIIGSMGYYMVRGHKSYKGPVTRVKVI